MGLGGYMAGLTEIEHYDSERKREMYEVENVPEREEEEIVEIFEPYGLNRSDLQPLLQRLKSNKESWVDFMMKFELALERPSRFRTWISAFTIGLSYLFGGLIPLIPYMIIRDNAFEALYISVGVTLLALFIFGFVKAKILGTPRPFLGALQMVLVGGAAAGCAFGIAKAIPTPGH
jgi:VIT1/CCC1 family predicted Fe2+/Mn2+ transporter